MDPEPGETLQEVIGALDAGMIEPEEVVVGGLEEIEPPSELPEGTPLELPAELELPAGSPLELPVGTPPEEVPAEAPFEFLGDPSSELGELPPETLQLLGEMGELPSEEQPETPPGEEQPEPEEEPPRVVDVREGQRLPQRRKGKYICVGGRNAVAGRLIKKRDGQWEDQGYDTFDAKDYQTALKRYEQQMETYIAEKAAGNNPSKPKKPPLPKLYYLSVVDGKAVRNDLKRDQKERCLGIVKPCVGAECPKSMRNRRESTLQGKRMKRVDKTKRDKRMKRKGKEGAVPPSPPRIIGCLVADDDETGESRVDATPLRDFIPKMDDKGRLQPLPPPGHSEEVCDEDKFKEWMDSADKPEGTPVPGTTTPLQFDNVDRGSWKPYQFEISLFDFLIKQFRIESLTTKQRAQFIRELINLDLSTVGNNAQGLERIRQFYISPDKSEDYLRQGDVQVDTQKGLEFVTDDANKELLQQIGEALGDFSAPFSTLVSQTLSSAEKAQRTSEVLSSRLNRGGNVIPGEVAAANVAVIAPAVPEVPEPPRAPRIDTLAEIEKLYQTEKSEGQLNDEEKAKLVSLYKSLTLGELEILDQERQMAPEERERRGLARPGLPNEYQYLLDQARERALTARMALGIGSASISEIEKALNSVEFKSPLDEEEEIKSKDLLSRLKGGTLNRNEFLKQLSALLGPQRYGRVIMEWKRQVAPTPQKPQEPKASRAEQLISEAMDLPDIPLVVQEIPEPIVSPAGQVEPSASEGQPLPAEQAEPSAPEVQPGQPLPAATSDIGSIVPGE